MNKEGWTPVSFSKPALSDMSSNMEPAFDEVDALSLEIMSEARMSLMMAFRFLDMALWRMPFKTGNLELPLATDGKVMYVSPYAVVFQFQEGYNELVRDLLHSILHCIFRHPYDTEHLNVPAWSLACDIVVEAVALEMCENRFSCARDHERKAELAHLEEVLGSLSPLKLYRLFASAEINAQKMVKLGFNAAKIWDLRQLFSRDGHEMWLNQRENPDSSGKKDQSDPIRKTDLSNQTESDATESEELNELDMDGNSPDRAETESSDNSEDESDPSQNQPDDEQSLAGADDEEDADGMSSEEAEALASLLADHDDEESGRGDEADESEASGAAESSDESSQDTPQSDESSSGQGQNQERAQDAPEGSSDVEDEPSGADQMDQEEWEQIAKQLKEDLETFSQNHDGSAGSLVANLAIANRKAIDYSDFLRQFSTMGEDMKINDDEFDYIFYTYGLDVYGNMPLVEPLEYQERNRVREFVIAIDTSGSCAGDLVKQFVMRTYQILRENEEFGDEVNIHIIQCDCRIQTDLKITAVADLEKYCETFQAFGFGGTDFRPVFEYVDQLLEEGEFENLRGLIYFTDGLGTFPSKMPEYETAFVFMDEEGSSVSVPPWAMKVVLDEDQIMTL